jgi:hypothetical protein
MALRLERESRQVLPPATHEALIAALADLLLEALETETDDSETDRSGRNEHQDHG